MRANNPGSSAGSAGSAAGGAGPGAGSTSAPTSTSAAPATPAGDAASTTTLGRVELEQPAGSRTVVVRALSDMTQEERDAHHAAEKVLVDANDKLVKDQQDKIRRERLAPSTPATPDKGGASVAE